MSSVVIHFPDGSKEFRYPAGTIQEGDRLWHDGEAFRVLAIGEGASGAEITVELDSTDLGDVLSSECGGVVLEEFVATG